MTDPDEALIYTAIALLPPTPLWALAWSAWTGRYRRWAISMGTDICSFQGRNYLPFPLGVFGAAWSMTVLYNSFATVLTSDQTTHLVLAAVWFITLATFLWWPPFFTPGWYKEWLKRSGGRSLDPKYLWPPDEWREIQKRERAKRQAKARKRIQRRQEKAVR